MKYKLMALNSMETTCSEEHEFERKLNALAPIIGVEREGVGLLVPPCAGEGLGTYTTYYIEVEEKTEAETKLELTRLLNRCKFILRYLLGRSAEETEGVLCPSCKAKLTIEGVGEVRECYQTLKPDGGGDSLAWSKHIRYYCPVCGHTISDDIKAIAIGEDE